MATDPGRVFIDNVMTRYAALFPAPSDAVTHKVGDLAFSEHDKPPIVKWRFGPIEHEPPVEHDSIATERQTFIIRIWGIGVDSDASESNARVIKNRLLLAARQIAQGTNGGVADDPISYGPWDWMPEAHTHHGRQLEGTIELGLPVVDQVFATHTVTAVEFDADADYDGDGTSDETHSTITKPAP